MFTDGDVAAILTAIDNSNRTGKYLSALDLMAASGMRDNVYDEAYGYATRTGLIRVMGMHNGVTRKGRRYLRSATLPPTHAASRRVPAYAVVDQDLDAGSMSVRTLADLERAMNATPGSSASDTLADLPNDATTGDL